MPDDGIERRRLLAAAVGIAGGSALAGCVGSLPVGDREEETIADSDGDGVIDSEDYAPRDPNVTDRSDVELVTETTARSSDEITRYEWDEETRGDADATVDGDEVDLRVFRCSSARAIARLGELSGDLTVSFDYTTRADEWNEIPFVRVRVDGEERYSSRDDDEAGITVEEYDRASGSFERTVAVDGATAVVLGIEESNHCSNGDHRNTYFEVEDLALEVA